MHAIEQIAFNDWQRRLSSNCNTPKIILNSITQIVFGRLLSRRVTISDDDCNYEQMFRVRTNYLMGPNRIVNSHLCKLDMEFTSSYEQSTTSTEWSVPVSVSISSLFPSDSSHIQTKVANLVDFLWEHPPSNFSIRFHEYADFTEADGHNIYRLTHLHIRDPGHTSNLVHRSIIIIDSENVKFIQQELLHTARVSVVTAIVSFTTQNSHAVQCSASVEHTVISHYKDTSIK